MESVLLSLALLACPVGMGAMMWFMMRGQDRRSATASASATDLRAEKARLTQEIDDLERRQLTEPVGGRR